MKDKLQRENTKNPDFKKKALKILKENADLFIFKRYLANKDFYHIKSEKEFDDFLSKSISKECLTIFKNKFEIIERGIIDHDFIKSVKDKFANERIVDWVIIGKEGKSQWSIWIDNEQAFRSAIEDEINNEVIVFKDQDWFNEDITIHTYVPDSDGIVRPGAY